MVGSIKTVVMQEELGEFMAPDWMGRNRQANPTLNNNQTKQTNRQTTLNDLWDLNRTLIVTYQVVQQWSDSQDDFPYRLTKHLSGGHCREQT